MGDGWVPAVLNSIFEYDFIGQGQRSFSSNVRYWIGGSTNQRSDYLFGYSDYLGDDSGKLP